MAQNNKRKIVPSIKKIQIHATKFLFLSDRILLLIKGVADVYGDDDGDNFYFIVF